MAVKTSLHVFKIHRFVSCILESTQTFLFKSTKGSAAVYLNFFFKIHGSLKKYDFEDGIIPSGPWNLNICVDSDSSEAPWCRGRCS